ncbi:MULTISPECIES: hypothetical protein [unclassified Campylobacter]|uniref:hypothetical protein n=1 Tax=unclassified Campylobacter TaxID=2593542 RepID=UPI0014755ABE|nr:MULTISPECIES: hypothetical protein [unclassified Campylobacter]QKG30010.1 hypothetical protein CDOMF_1781 [Campylobacter sp. RM16187]
MKANEILNEVGRELSDTEQEFLKLLSNYESKDNKDGETSFDMLNCAFDLFWAMKNFTTNMSEKSKVAIKALFVLCNEKIQAEILKELNEIARKRK